MFLFVGLVLLTVGIVGASNSRRLVDGGLRTTAEVVDVQWWSSTGTILDPPPRGRFPVGAFTSRHGGDLRGSYYPVVSFRAADGQEVRARTRSGRVPAPARVGQRVQVIYDPRNPRNVALDTPAGRGMTLSVFAAIVGAGTVVFQLYQMTR